MAETTNLPALDPLDRRLNAFRADLADARLQGRVDAKKFTEGEPAWISVAMADLVCDPSAKGGIDTQLIYGEAVRVFDRQEGKLWVQNELDSYVGWIDEQVVSEGEYTPTHVVSIPRTFFYPGPDLKFRHKGMRSMGSRLCVVDEVENRGTRYAVLATGEAVIAHHIRPIGEHDADYVEVAERLLHTPYLWAGTSAFGIDCSGLVKLSMQMAGHKVLRDSDMQAATIGTELSPDEGPAQLKRGDLVFWKGHLAICQGNGTIIHANGHTMTVASEPLEQAVERIAYLYSKPIGYRRPESVQ